MNISEHAQLEQMSLEALTPDGLLPYVQAVSPVHSDLLHGYVIHRHGGHVVMVGYTLQDFLDGQQQSPFLASANPPLATALTILQKQKDIQRITLLAPTRPPGVPDHATVSEDAYYFLPLPWKAQNPQQHKVLSMCRRATPHIFIEQDVGAKAWTGAHQELMLHYIRRPHMHKDMGAILQRLGNYCRQSSHVRVFSAYDTQSKELMGTVLGDFTSLHTAFYMFAFRSAHAVPGTAEALLLALIQEAQLRGYAWCNLGLGIHDGIRFFKEKWGALPLLPCVECSWTTQVLSQPPLAKKALSPLHWLSFLWRKNS